VAALGTNKHFGGLEGLKSLTAETYRRGIHEIKQDKERLDFFKNLIGFRKTCYNILIKEE
jgi:hypothetical protein